MNALSAMDIYVKAKYNIPEKFSEAVVRALKNSFKAVRARYSLFWQVEYRDSRNFMMSRNPDIYLFRALFILYRKIRVILNARYARKVRLTFIVCTISR